MHSSGSPRRFCGDGRADRFGCSLEILDRCLVELGIRAAAELKREGTRSRDGVIADQPEGAPKKLVFFAGGTSCPLTNGGHIGVSPTPAQERAPPEPARPCTARTEVAARAGVATASARLPSTHGGREAARSKSGKPSAGASRRARPTGQLHLLAERTQGLRCGRVFATGEAVARELEWEAGERGLL